MDPLPSYTGVSTANAVTPSIMPTSILFDHSLPSSVFRSPYSIETLSPEMASLMQSYSFPTGLSYTLSGNTATAPNAQTAIPSAASFYDNNGGIGVTNLPSGRLGTGTGGAVATTMATVASSSTDAGVSTTPAAYNPNGASTKVTRNGVAVLLLVVSALLL